MGLLLISNFMLLPVGSEPFQSFSTAFKGLNGLRFDSTGQLYVGSVAEQTIYRVNLVTGETALMVRRTISFTPNGQIFYTALLSGEVRTFSPQVGKVTIAASIPAVDPIAQDRAVVIFVGQSLSLSNTGLYGRSNWAKFRV